MSDFASIERLCDELARTPELPAATHARALVQEVLALHGRGLARALELVGDATAAKLADDPLVAALLLLHGLHPRPLAERARAALAPLGASVDLDVEGKQVNVRCAPGARAAVEAALYQAVPDADAIDIEARVALIPASRLAAGRAR
jgi:hypothetical protein